MGEIGYNASASTGVTLLTATEWRSVVVTGEALEKSKMAVGESQSYTATVEDSKVPAEALPPTFAVRLEADGVVLASVSFTPAIYDPATRKCAISFTAPSAILGKKTVRLAWDDQVP